MENIFKKIVNNKYVRGAVIGAAVVSVPFIAGIKRSYVNGFVDGVETREQIYKLQENIERTENEIKKFKKENEILENRSESLKELKNLI